MSPKCPQKIVKKVWGNPVILMQFFRKCFFQRVDTRKLLSVDHMFPKISEVETIEAAFSKSSKNTCSLYSVLYLFTAPTRFDEEFFINKNANPPDVITFHPYLPHLVVADRVGVSTWNYEAGLKLNHFNNCNPKTSRITSLDILNSHDLSLLLTGSGEFQLLRNPFSKERSRKNNCKYINLF